MINKFYNYLYYINSGLCNTNFSNNPNNSYGIFANTNALTAAYTSSTFFESYNAYIT